MGFRKMRGVHIAEERQGLIFYTCLNYSKLSEKTKAKIARLCREQGGEHSCALFELVTTKTNVTKLARKHYVSESTLYELRRRFYEAWEK